jgi:hypothetical protein
VEERRLALLFDALTLLFGELLESEQAQGEKVAGAEGSPARERITDQIAWYDAKTRRNALELSDARWSYDVGRLLLFVVATGWNIAPVPTLGLVAAAIAALTLATLLALDRTRSVSAPSVGARSPQSG